MSFYDDVDMLEDPAYANKAASTEAPKKKSRIPYYYDYRKLEQEHDIKKFKFEPDGEYKFSFLPFRLESTHPRYKDLVSEKRPNPIGFKLAVNVHTVKNGKYDNKVICPKTTMGEDCPICDEKWRVINEGKYKTDEEQKAYLKTLNEKPRTLYYVLNHADNKVYVMDYSDFWFEEILAKKLARSNGTEQQVVFANPKADGHYLHFFIDPHEFRQETIAGKASDLEFIPRKEAIPTDLLEGLPCLSRYMKVYTEEELGAMLSGEYFIEEEGDTWEEDTPPSEETSSPEPMVKLPEGTVLGKVEEETKEVEPPQKTPEEIRAERIAQREAKKKAPATPECPSGYSFGADNMLYDECDSCPIQQACEAKYNEITG